MRFLVCFFFLCGCSIDNICYNQHYSNTTNYSVSPNVKTPNGIKVDTTNFIVDLNDIDRRIDEVETCLKQKYPDGKLPLEIIQNGHCLYPTFDTNIHRSCLEIKVAPDWHVGCLGEEIFPCSIDPKYCLAKGITPTQECPCECRSAIQDQNVIVITPDLYLLKGDMIRLQTGCNFIWIDGLQECFSN